MPTEPFNAVFIIHELMDLLVESDSPNKQYDFSTRKESALKRAEEWLRRPNDRRD